MPQIYATDPYSKITSDFMYKRSAIQTATELGYSNTVINELKNAETSEEISRIMMNARKRLEDS